MLSYDLSQNEKDILSIISKIAYLSTNMSLYVTIFGYHLFRANSQAQVRKEKDEKEKKDQKEEDDQKPNY